MIANRSILSILVLFLKIILAIPGPSFALSNKFSNQLTKCYEKVVGILPWVAFNLCIHLEVTHIFAILSLPNHSISCSSYSIRFFYGQLNCCNQRLLINASVSIQSNVFTALLQDSVLGPVLLKICQSVIQTTPPGGGSMCLW